MALGEAIGIEVYGILIPSTALYLIWAVFFLMILYSTSLFIKEYPRKNKYIRHHLNASIFGIFTIIGILDALALKYYPTDILVNVFLFFLLFITLDAFLLGIGVGAFYRNRKTQISVLLMLLGILFGAQLGWAYL